ncbi:MAG TPA: ABC transporter substrate-binding protein [Blastocatellia bacterium]|nr:ABC transporter substrate-binding protein [Blastocatellia bacterium]
MRRREFIALVGAAIVARPLAIQAQQLGKVYQIGFLASRQDRERNDFFACFVKALEQLNWVEGQNIRIEYRHADGRPERFPTLAAQLVSLNLDVIVAGSTQASQAVQRTTSEIPVVFGAVTDPVGAGLVASLARPGGNITGVSNFQLATTGKILELLKEAVPIVTRVIVLHDPTNDAKLGELKELKAIGAGAGVTIEAMAARNAEGIEHGFSSLEPSPSIGLIVLVDTVTLANSDKILSLAATKRLPAIYQTRRFVDGGGLMSYGTNFCQLFARTAHYVDKILKGTRPSELPAELPMKFELVFNLKAANALGLAIPPTLLARADDVIE